MGGITIYEGSLDFPARIPDILSARGFAVLTASDRFQKATRDQKNGFAFGVSDSDSTFDVVGSEEEEVWVCVHIFYRAGGIVWGKHKWQRMQSSHERLVAALLEGGMRVWSGPKNTEAEQVRPDNVG